MAPNAPTFKIIIASPILTPGLVIEVTVNKDAVEQTVLDLLSTAKNINSMSEASDLIQLKTIQKR